jgi:release factor glutamine methyltransferase
MTLRITRQRPKSRVCSSVLALETRPIMTYDIGKLTVRLLDTTKVMPPSPYSLLLARHLACGETLADKTVLDVGTGSGILAVVAARRGARLAWAVDIDNNAPPIVHVNAKLNGQERRIRPILGNMFKPFNNVKFDLIMCNPPSLPMSDTSGSVACYSAGREGRRFIDALISESGRHLAPNGVLAFVNTSLANMALTERMLACNGYTHQVVMSQLMPFRPFYFVHREWLEFLQKEGKASFESINGALYERLYLVRAVFTQ